MVFSEMKKENVMGRMHFGLGLAAAVACASVACAADGELLRIATEKASLELSLQGGRVTSFRVRGDELLWRPRIWRLGGKGWAHGGIPLCWPWFGASGPDPAVAHGFAWKRTFELRSKSETPTRSELVLGLRSDDATRRLWPHDFDLEYRIVLTDRLHLQLTTWNIGKEPFLLTAGFHPYFALGDRDRAWVTETDGMRFCDSRATTEYGKVWSGDLKLLSSMDHVFVEPKGQAFHAIVDPVLSRRIGVASSGAARLVVWNPGEDFAVDDMPAPGALAKGDWRHLICVEPAILWREAARTVAPGATHVLSAEITREAYP